MFLRVVRVSTSLRVSTSFSCFYEFYVFLRVLRDSTSFTCFTCFYEVYVFLRVLRVLRALYDNALMVIGYRYTVNRLKFVL